MSHNFRQRNTTFLVWVPINDFILQRYETRAVSAHNRIETGVFGFLYNCIARWRHQMDTFSAFLGPLWGESSGRRWIPLTKASDGELWCVLWSVLDKWLSKQSSHLWFEMPSRSLWRHYNGSLSNQYFWTNRWLLSTLIASDACRLPHLKNMRISYYFAPSCGYSCCLNSTRCTGNCKLELPVTDTDRSMKPRLLISNDGLGAISYAVQYQQHGGIWCWWRDNWSFTDLIYLLFSI